MGRSQISPRFQGVATATPEGQNALRRSWAELHGHGPRNAIEHARIADLRGDRDAAGGQLESILRRCRELRATGYVERLERLLQT